MRAWLRQWRQWRRRLRQWWCCQTERCDYYTHYLAWGPPEMPHATWHHVMAQAKAHFRDCTYHEHPRYPEGFTPDGKLDLCPMCRSYEQRIRA
jgi:hypothetical protein